MKNSVLFSALFALAFASITPLASKNVNQNPATQTTNSGAKSANNSCDNACYDCCGTNNSGTNCSWLSKTWCSVKNWAMSLFGKHSCQDDQCSQATSGIAASSEQDDSEEANIPFKDNQ